MEPNITEPSSLQLHAEEEVNQWRVITHLSNILIYCSLLVQMLRRTIDQWRPLQEGKILKLILQLSQSKLIN